MILIPDVRQPDDYSCGVACVTALLQAHGLPRPRYLRRLVNPDRGLSPDTVEAVLFDVLKRPPLRGSCTVQDLQHWTRHKRPVLCPVTADGVGHWVVVRGVRRGRVYYHDPSNGPGSKPVPAWLDWWRVLPECSPYQRFAICA